MSKSQGVASRPAPRKSRLKAWPRALKNIVYWRRPTQALVGLAMFLSLNEGWITLTWILIVGSALGLLLGKFFCRWMCPLGFVMETLMSAGDDQGRMMYQYFKVGCPIAWIGGLLNRLSFLRVRLDRKACVSCGKCDQVCYIATHNEARSLHEPARENASTHFSCSRCLKCVDACPTGALTLSPRVSTAPKK